MPRSTAQRRADGLDGRVVPHADDLLRVGCRREFRDIDGNEYLDFNVADLSMSAGFGPPPIVAAVSAQVGVGRTFSADAGCRRGRRAACRSGSGLPFWQATLSATGANTEVMRIARIATGRERIVVFRGHYHGHLEETLVKAVDGRSAPKWRVCHGMPARRLESCLSTIWRRSSGSCEPGRWRSSLRSRPSPIATSCCHEEVPRRRSRTHGEIRHALVSRRSSHLPVRLRRPDPGMGSRDGLRRTGQGTRYRYSIRPVRNERLARPIVRPSISTSTWGRAGSAPEARSMRARLPWPQRAPP